MNPIFLSALAAFFKKVKCPQCQRDQMVTHGYKKAGLRCKFCGYMILPPPESTKR